MAEPTIPFEAVAALRAEIHRVFCGGAKHRSRFTGMCSTGAPANVLRGLAANPDAARKVAAALLTEEWMGTALLAVEFDVVDDEAENARRAGAALLAALRAENPENPEEPQPHTDWGQYPVGFRPEEKK